MPRIVLEEQDKYEFSFDIQVRISDLNVAGHVGNSEMVDIIHEGRTQLFKALGLSEVNLGDNRHGMILAELAINFKSESFLGDTLIIKCHIGEFGSKGFRIFYRVSRKGDIIALAETGHVVLDFTERRTAPVPDLFKKTVSDFQKKNGL